MLALSIAGDKSQPQASHTCLHRPEDYTKTAFSDPLLRYNKRWLKIHIKPYIANMNQESSSHTVQCTYHKFVSHCLGNLFYYIEQGSKLFQYLLINLHLLSKQ